MTFTAYIRKSKINTIGWNGHVYILGFPEIEEMDVFALKAHPLHDKKDCDQSKNNFCIYMFTLETTKNIDTIEPFKLKSIIMQNKKVPNLGQSLKQGSL